MVQDTELMAFSQRLRMAAAARGWPEHGLGAELARITSVTPKAASKWLNGESMPRPGKLAPIAAALGVTRVWLQHGEGPMEPAIDISVGVGVMGVAEPIPVYRSEGRIPVISYVQAGAFCDAEDPFPPGFADEYLPFRPPNAGPRAYALRVEGDSNHPKIRHGEYVIVDPDRAPDSGKFVVAKRHSDAKVTLKQIQYNEGEPFLKPGNPDWPEPIIKIDGGWSICGVVIGKYDPM